MTYPGSPELSADAQQRVLSAFRRAITLLQDGNRPEAMIALDFTLRLDPAFEPARNLSNQLSAGRDEIDLGSMITDLGLPSEEEIQAKLVDAVDDFNERRLPEAKEKAEAVLRELPGNQEARRLLAQIDHALESEAQIGTLLSGAQQHLSQGRPGEAAELVMKAQAIDPGHPGITALLREIQAAAPAPPPSPPEDAATPAPPAGASAPVEFAFDATDGGEESTAVAEGFETLPEGAPLFDEQAGRDSSFELDEFLEPAGDSGTAAPPSTEDATGTEEEPGLDAGDLADLFDDSASPAEAVGEAPSESGGEEGSRVAELYRQGQEAFEREDFLEAIDIWSRIYLIDPENAQASAAIDEARKRQDEIDRAVEQRVFEAQEAADAGDVATALRITGEILAEHPDNLAARELEENLKRKQTATPPPPPPGEDAATPPPSSDDLDAELFDASAEAIPEPTALPEIPEPSSEEPAPGMPAALGRRIPNVRVILLGLGALAIVAIGLWFGSRLMAGNHGAQPAPSANRILAQAEELYRKGQPEKAIRLLEGFQASSRDQVRVAQRLRKYKKALAPPTPTPPPPESVEAQQAFDAGKWLTAYRLAARGLASHPGDPGLMALTSQILSKEGQIGPLVHAEDQGDYETAVGIARELLTRYPKHPEFRDELARDLFNLAVNDLRTYNLTGAANQLNALLKINPTDAESKRILEFIAKYQARPVDMQLKVFIASLSYR